MNNHAQLAKDCRKKYIRRGGCAYCGSPRKSFTRLCDECQKKQNVASLRFVHSTRQLAINAYGGKCVCCGEVNFGFLTLGHVQDDGASHRRITKCGTGYKFYRWLKKRKFPTGIVQVECWNCNCGKRDNGGVCPHKGLSIRNQEAA